MAPQDLLQLNLTEIIRTRAGKRGRLIPRFLLRGLERVIRQEELNEMLRVAYPAMGSEFSSRILNHLDITVSVKGLDPIAATGEKYIFASNHPLGGLDGIALVAVLGSRYGDDNIKVMVNDLLMNVSPLADVFLPVNKYGSAGARESSRLLSKALDEGKQIVMFPAGLVSRLHDDGSVRDLEWKKSFVTKALESGRKIVPVKFEAANSMKFYRLAKYRKKAGIKINIEQALLPSELCKSRSKRFSINFHKPVDPVEMRAMGMSVNELVSSIYNTVYNMPSSSFHK